MMQTHWSIQVPQRSGDWTDNDCSGVSDVATITSLVSTLTGTQRKPAQLGVFGPGCGGH